MNEQLTLYTNLLKQKNKLLLNLYQYVSSKNFKVDEDEIEHIENYMNKRDQLFDEIFKLQNLIDNKHNPKFVEDEIISSIIEKNDTIIKLILNLDKINQDKFQKIFDSLKENIKSLKNTEKANKNYFGSYDLFFGGNYFNTES